MTDHGKHRRTFLKEAGTIGIAGGLTALAGCAGDGGDGGGDGGDGGGGDGGDGGGGDGGDGGSTGDGGDGGTQEFRVGMPPLGPAVVAYNYINEQTDILQNAMDEAGYSLDVTVTWDEITLFAAGQVDMVPSLSDIEGARIATERELPVVFHGIYATNYEGWYVRKGSDWDPEVHGNGVQGTLDMLAEGNGTWGNAGWNQGSVVPGQICTKSEFGYDYGPDQSDFNVQQADWFALPELLVDEEVDMITNAPPLGTDAQLAKEDDGNNPIKDIYWYQPGLENAGFSAMTCNLGLFGAHEEFANNHREAMRAFLSAWREGSRYVSNPDNFEEILDNEDNWEALTANNREEARIVLEFSQQPPEWCMTEPGNSARVIVEEPTIDSDYVETDKAAISRAEELGAVPSGWEDWVTYDPIELD